MNTEFNVKRYERRRANYLRAISAAAEKLDPNARLRPLHPFDGAPVNDSFVLVADWNNPRFDSLEKIVRAWESVYYVSTAFDDEIYFCENCGVACHARPSFYGADLSWTWLPDGYTLLCRSCFSESDLDGYVNQSEYALPHWALDVARGAGFFRLTDVFETGFHAGQTDNPAVELARLTDNNPGREFIPYIVGSGQFDVQWGLIYRALE